MLETYLLSFQHYSSLFSMHEQIVKLIRDFLNFIEGKKA
jgi:hypothetical protein